MYLGIQSSSLLSGNVSHITFCYVCSEFLATAVTIAHAVLGAADIRHAISKLLSKVKFKL